MPRKAPLGNTPREYFAIKYPFSRPNPLNHAWRTNLAAPPHPGGSRWANLAMLDGFGWANPAARRLPLDEEQKRQAHRNKAEQRYRGCPSRFADTAANARKHLDKCIDPVERKRDQHNQSTSYDHLGILAEQRHKWKTENKKHDSRHSRKSP